MVKALEVSRTGFRSIQGRLMWAILVGVGLFPPSADISTASAEDDDCPYRDCTKVVAPRVTCPDGWTCVEGGYYYTSPRLPTSGNGSRLGGEDVGPADQRDEDEEQEERDECWKNLTANPKAPVSGKFGEQRDRGPHKGLDIEVVTGTTVYTVRGGTVLETRKSEAPMPPKNDNSPEAQKIRQNATSTGNYVRIQHDDGTVGRFLHLKKNAVWVSQGQRVSAGQSIGQSNATGIGITGPHLHTIIR